MPQFFFFHSQKLPKKKIKIIFGVIGEDGRNFESFVLTGLNLPMARISFGSNFIWCLISFFNPFLLCLILFSIEVTTSRYVRAIVI